MAQIRPPRQFTFRDLIFDLNSPQEQYHRRTDDLKTSIHWGQRKLLLSEIEFFTLYWNPREIPNPICVYAGAAPGIHIPLLSKMFPQFTFELYDPSPFTIESTDKIKIFNDYFIDDVAAKYSNRNDIFFISDIRTADHRSIREKVFTERGIPILETDRTNIPVDIIRDALTEATIRNEDQIWGDMAMQQNWVLIMNPAHALLKFRLPYPHDGNDKIVQYLKGIVHIQSWPGPTSTETRLKPVRNANGVYDQADWSILEYERWCFHHNNTVRERWVYENIFTNTNNPIDYPELLNDYDSVSEAFILKLYLEKIGAGINVQYQKVKNLSRLITLSINRHHTQYQGAKSLSDRRADTHPTVDLDVFRVKHKTPLVRRKQFHHTNISINPTWRENTDIPQRPPTRSPATIQAPVIVAPPARSPATIQTPIIVAPPARSPATIQTPIIVAPPARSPATIQTPVIVAPPARSPAAIQTPVIVAPPARSPATIQTPVIVAPRGPATIQTPMITPLQTPLIVAPLTRSPAIPVNVPSSNRLPAVPVNVPSVPRS